MKLLRREPSRAIGVSPVGRAGACLLVLLAWLAAAPAVVAEDDDVTRYLGVKTCAGSTCHGAGGASDSRVLQNEFQTWHRQDKHAKAYEVLAGERGQRIARNLGLDSATSAPECLACHATYVPAEQRGKRFSLSDGVSCESCHGPASRWLGQHVAGEASRAENIAKGMYPTEDPVKRAALCLSCHLGQGERFADHRLMGAGHPRLSFELDTFTRIQPAHFRVDADYRARKQVAPGLRVWAVGQIAAARRFLDLFTSGKHPGNGAFPEFAFFDCHACHHAFTTPRWQPRASNPLPPGTPHLNDANLLMLSALASRLDEAVAGRLDDAVKNLHAASLLSLDATLAAARTLDGVLAELERSVAGAALQAAEPAAVLRAVITRGRAGDYNDYAAAEQATMAVAALVDALAEAGAIDAARREALAAKVAALYDATAKQDSWQPAVFDSALEALDATLD
ncbi:MAG: multiheme c-type cytochrome [Gammaproteobacteria bacterium]